MGEDILLLGRQGFRAVARTARALPAGSFVGTRNRERFKVINDQLDD